MASRRIRRLLGVLAVVLWVSVASNASAQAVTAADKETARGLMDMGRAAEAKGDYEAAAKAYEGADRLMGVPSTALSLGRARMQLGQLVAARDAMLRAARYPKRPSEPKVFSEARREATLLAESLGRSIPTLTVEVRGLDEGTKPVVTVDDAVLDSALLGLPQRIDPGEHVVSVRGEGIVDVERKVTLVEEQAERLVLTVEADPNAVAVPTTTPTAPDTEEPSTEAGGISPWVWVGIGVGGAGVIAGSVTGALSLSAVSSAKEQCDGNVCPAAAKSDADRGKVLGHASTVSFAVGGAGLVTALVAGIFFSSDDADTAVVLPLIAPDHVGVRVRF